MANGTALPGQEPLAAPLTTPRLRLMTCGSVDDGKSTLIGRLLHDSGAIFEDHEAEVRKTVPGGDIDFSFFVDGLKAEREQGITIDVAYRFFATARRSFLIADAPGHEQYTRNQAAAASQAQVAIVLVSAADGIQPQTRRHMAIASLFGLRDIVVAVNKMDLVGRRAEPFATVAAEIRGLAAGLGLRVAGTVPICAREGDNVVIRSTGMDWYTGPTLLDVLEHFTPPAVTDGAVLLPIAHTGRMSGGGRVSFGQVAAGRIAVGDRLRTETGLDATVTRIWAAGEPAETASLGEPVAAELEPEIDLGRGAVLASPDKPVGQVEQVRVRFVWLIADPVQTSRTYDVELGTARAGAKLSRIEGRLDLDALALTSVDDNLAANDIAVARLTLVTPIAALPFADNRRIGAFILVDRMTRRTVAAGIVLSIERQSRDVPWQVLQITAEDRARAMGQRPAVIWLTGLSGAGKSTIADLLDRKLHSLGRHTVALDGDNLRHGLTADLGFSDADRLENIRRVGHAAALMADAGLIVIVSLISPFRAGREGAREAVGAARFIEVFVDAPLDVCRQRDPKGHYARALAGNLPRFTGIGAAYEAPEAPDLHLHTDQLSPELAVERILEALRSREREG